MAGVLLVYATTHGHASKIPKRIAETVSAEGLEVDLRELDGAGSADPGPYGAALVTSAG